MGTGAETGNLRELEGGDFLGKEAKVYCQDVGSRKISLANVNKSPPEEKQTLLLSRETGMDNQGKQILIFWAEAQQHQF